MEYRLFEPEWFCEVNFNTLVLYTRKVYFMSWTVKMSRSAEKSKMKLSKPIRQILFALIHDIESAGPVRGDWPNYGKLADGKHHCHLKKGSPTYVAVWVEVDRKIKLVEVTYVGTHEKAPY